jgi:hypothetical protein
MREENENLKLAIADIISATQHGNKHRLFGAVRNAAKIAGLEASAIVEESGDSTYPDNLRKGHTPGVPPSPVPLPHKKGGQEKGHTADALPCASSSLESQSSVSERQVHSRAWNACFMASRRKSASRSRCLSPRLDYGIWIDASSAVRIDEPSPFIVPFLGTGRYKFAGQVFWACTDYLISLCRVATTPYSPCEWFDHSQGRRPSPKEAEERVWSIIQHTPPMGNVRLALTLAEAQLEFRDNGHIYGDSPVSDGETATLLQQELEAEYAALGNDMSVWMDVMELERHVRRKLGNEAFGRLERAIASYNTRLPEPMGEESLTNPEVCMVVRLLVKNLAESYVCFGDGPRWRVDSVSALFDEKMIA